MSRSYLFVPADSERKLAKAADSSADALILDLEDSVAEGEKPRARNLAREFLDDKGDRQVWVRINALSTAYALDDLSHTVPGVPDGIVLPKPGGADDARQLARLLDDLEEKHDLPSAAIRVVPIATEVPAALFRLHEYAGSTRRLAALSWGAEDLSAAVGAMAKRDEQGNWLPPYELARSLCLFAAAAAEVPAIDTVYADFKDSHGLARYARNARRDGFAGMLAIHPAQAEIINDAFSPAAAEVERAQRIVALFDANPDAGVVAMDGKMLDRPHLLQARKILAMAGTQDN